MGDGMTEDEVEACLRSVGYAAFVDHLDLFQGGGSVGDTAEDLHARTGWSVAACRTRVSKARRIISAGETKTALAIIASAEKVSPDVTARANALRRA
jgi:hypothetical protein